MSYELFNFRDRITLLSFIFLKHGQTGTIAETF